jgi:hypothetical protein
MKKTIVSSITLIFALALTASFAFAQEKKPGMDKMKMDMSMDEMHKSPEHMLMMAYKNNLETFSRTLVEAANDNPELQPYFARALVAEMRRSADKMKDIHKDHMSMMSAEQIASMSEMMEKMKLKDAEQEEHIKALEGLVKSEYLNNKEIIKHAEPLAGSSDKMKMMEDHKMKDKDSMKDKMN